MRIEHFGGIIECNELNEIDSILSLRYGNGINEFWINADEKYPCLAIMVNNNYAYLH